MGDYPSCPSGIRVAESHPKLAPRVKGGVLPEKYLEPAYRRIETLARIRERACYHGVDSPSYKLPPCVTHYLIKVSLILASTCPVKNSKV
jgi:hypothetical protein